MNLVYLQEDLVVNPSYISSVREMGLSDGSYTTMIRMVGQEHEIHLRNTRIFTVVDKINLAESKKRIPTSLTDPLWHVKED